MKQNNMPHSLVLGAVLLVWVIGSQVEGQTDEDGFRPLFNGKSLDGWVQHGGQAKYAVQDGQIVGTAVPNTPNSFLCTKEHFSDFILELDFKVDPALNSGVQIRSNVYDQPKTVEIKSSSGKVKHKTIPAGRVHGYQVEIDPSSRAWTGGIYDEGRRGWLFDLSKNEAARKAFRQNQWNHFRIEARGESIKTWLNGVPAADLQDGMTRSGFIALQVHSVGRHPERAGKQVRWRNIRIKVLSASPAAVAPAPPGGSPTGNAPKQPSS